MNCKIPDSPDPVFCMTLLQLIHELKVLTITCSILPVNASLSFQTDSSASFRIRLNKNE